VWDRYPECSPRDPLPLLESPTVQKQDEGLFLLDAAGTIRTWTPAAESLFGYSERDVVGQPVAMLFCNGPGGNPLQPGDAARVVRDHDSARREGRGRRSDGSTFSADLSVSRIEVAGHVWLAGLARDLTQQKILEARLQQAHRLETVGQLAGGIAHDFNNLLMVVAGRCESLRGQSDLSDSQRAALDQIAGTVEQAATLTARLLAFSRRPQVERRTVDLNAALRQTGELLRRTIRGNLRFDIQLYPRPLRTRIDATHVSQILINLAVNARDAMPDGGVFSVRTRPIALDAVQAAERDVPPGDFILLDIADDGPGMTAEVRAQAFEPFFTTKPAERGTGLGLASVHSIVTSRGGHIELDTAPGQGTRFTILLPAVADDVEQELAAASAPRPPRGHETILVVEDEAPVREIVTTMLRDLGYRPLEAGSVEEAALVSQRQEIDLVLTDVVMPLQTGRQLAERLWQARPGLKVLFMSGHADDVVLSRSPERSELTFLQKPFGRLALARRLRELLDPA
jgi:two-component system cell cycle sensor histidine kinase/response regulator CckA